MSPVSVSFQLRRLFSRHWASSSFSTSSSGNSSQEKFHRVYESFKRQGLMNTIGAQLSHVSHGRCVVRLPYSDKVTQQQGGFHGGAIGAIADIAAGYSSLSVAPEGMEVTTVEYKINFLAAFKGGTLRAEGRIVKNGKRVMVTTAEVYHEEEGDKKETLCAVMQQSLVTVPKKY